MVKMRNFNLPIAFILVVVLTAFKSAGGDKVLKHRQNAVFSLVGSENFYVEMKKKIPVTYVDDGQLGHLRDYDYSNNDSIDYEQYKNLQSPSTQQIPTERDQMIDLYDKNMICSSIFNSPFFVAKGEVTVLYYLMQPETMNELRESKRDTYDDIYGDYPNIHGQWLNPYKRRTVLVGGERFEEHTFRCLTRRLGSKTAAVDSYVDYFVSPIYQSKRPKDLVMNGRFVFTSNEDKELILIATAEERVSKVIKNSISEIHQYYYEKNQGHQYPKPDETSNVLCTLTMRDKIRLCDSVMNSPNFPDKISFISAEANVTDKCEEIRVLGEVKEHKKVQRFFRRTWKDKIETIEITYDQWMVGCKGIGMKPNSVSFSSWYFISPGMTSDAVVVFKKSANENENGYSSFVGLTSVYWAERVYGDMPIETKATGKSK